MSILYLELRSIMSIFNQPWVCQQIKAMIASEGDSEGLIQSTWSATNSTRHVHVGGLTFVFND